MDKICRQYMKGTCNNPRICGRIHDPDFCQYLYFDGFCKKGDRCNFNHIPFENSKRKNKNPPIIRNKKRARNTETFKPSHKPPDMRFIPVYVSKNDKDPKYSRPYETREVIFVDGLFCERDDLSIYNSLLEEIKQTGLEEKGLWKSWHGDSHLIADDHLNWKKSCPTFNKIIETIANYFSMDVKATRFNWYRDSKEWKPFHHDAAAIKMDKAKAQNFTVGISFGAEREAAFEHVRGRNIISVPLSNGTIYTFSRDVNIEWKHGILQKTPDSSIVLNNSAQESLKDEGRVSIIAWGWVDQKE